ncbi:E3 ubiquitin-protein ligase RNF216-like isoform X4 [Homarus americanus]|uniref:E3 ubiquitin-protein ligase RNF216-like isoform X4 n=1 Tax=Homarus americanus TaxID=6706 RepID=UPI001C469DC8|nr:E3 ubiquitin-protein ligase RNF216-like isoform X4 [Homarus americanus]
MKMEPLAEAFLVVEGVVAHICEKLGSDAREHMNPDQLFVRAEYHIKNGLNVDDAIKMLVTSVIWEVKDKFDKKLRDVKKIRDELERATAEVIIGQIRGELERASEHLVKDVDLNINVRLGSEGSSSQSFSTSDGASGENKVKLGMAFSDSSDSASSSSVDDPPLPLESPGSDTTVNDEDSEIRVLTPEPRKPAPLIELTDDSSNGSTSSKSSICIVEECEKTKDKPISNLEEEIDLEDAEKIGFTNKTLADILKEERILANGTNGEQSEQEVKMHEVCDLNKGASKHLEPMKAEVPENDCVFNDIDQTNSEEQRYQLHIEERKQSPEHEGPGSPSSATLNELKASSYVDENRNKKTNINGLANFLTDNRADHSHSTDVLWKDAQYVCSLLPYFQLADVHQSMVDNYFHPDRKAYVLEEYIKLAVDREEVVSDCVFQSLRAVRKRAYVEVGGAQAVMGEKKIKVEHNSADFIDKKLWDPVFDGSLPSTSGANNPVALAVVRDKNEQHGVYMPDVRTQNNDFEPEFKKNEPMELKNDREKWCIEKMEFVAAVICGIDKEVLREQVESCYSDADVERLITRLLEEQENSEPVIKDPEPGVGYVNPLSLARIEQPNTSAFQLVDRAHASVFEEGNSNDGSTPGSSNEGQSVAEGEDQAKLASDLEDTIMNQTKTLSEMFGDADPDYLQKRCAGINGDPAQFQMLVDELLKNKEYPKIEEYNKRKKRLEIRKKFIEGMSVEEFLEYFEDPEKVFNDTSKPTSTTYMENAKAQLMLDLRFHLSRDIDTELRKHNFHYLPTLRALQENSKLSRRKTKRARLVNEKDMDDIFIKELCYVRMQTEIKEHLWNKEEDKRSAFIRAKTNDQLKECQCCYDDEVLADDMDTCSAPGTEHIFCINCIRRFAEEEIGQGRTTFRCLEGDCKAEFSLSTLKRIMKPAVFSNILERKQLEEIAAAGIEDLVACPFCNFQTIMPNQEDKVFKCLNPECMKDSCRMCKEPNHVPLRCEEVEKQHQKDARTYMENRMTEAMVRECWKCKKRFIKEDGCNKMRCSCGAMMCYICKKQIKGYDHFEDKPVPTDPRKCPLWSNSEKIHAEEVRDIADKLKQEMEPGLELVHNPLNDLPEVVPWPDYTQAEVHMKKHISTVPYIQVRVEIALP